MISSTLLGVSTTAGLVGSGSSVLSMYSPPTNASGGGVSRGTDYVCVCGGGERLNICH